MMIKKILVPLDLSKTAIKAADFAFQTALQMGASLAFICVLDKQMLEVNPDAGEFPDTKRIKVKEVFISEIEAIEAKHPNLSVEKIFLTQGEPVEKILEKARTWQADLIIMGSHGRSGLSHLLMGSITQNVIKNSLVPVLIVKK